MLQHTTSALIGHTGFVGTTLMQTRTFTDAYHSRNIAEIAHRSFDLLVCAGAPASMWAANQDPGADEANLIALSATLSSVDVKHFVLISTIAVFDDPSAGYDEHRAGYEIEKAYGRNRRAFEERLQARFPDIHILRLPALFGKGLKKNFVFDLINPVPSFLRPDAYAALHDKIEPSLAAVLAGLYRLDGSLNMMVLDRPALDLRSDKPDLTRAIIAAGMDAARFTNSASEFQYYDMSRLANDIDKVIADDLRVVNICSEPVSAGEIHAELTGARFENAGPPVMREDMRSIHAGRFDGTDPYLFDRHDTLNRLKRFYQSEVSR